MNIDTAALTTKSVGTAIGAVAFLTLSPMAWAAAFLGAAMSYYFEPEHSPGGALKLLFGITAMGFAAAMLAGAAPHLGWGIGPAAENVPIEIRAGLFGLMVRLIYEWGKSWLRFKKPGGVTP